MKAVAYLRTSSATNVGEDKDSKKRQQDAIAAFAAKNDIEVVGEYYDAAVTGTDSITERDGFSAMLDYIAGNGARTVLVESISRFSRDYVVQITGYEYLKKIGINLIPTDIPDYFKEDTPSAEMVRGILALVAQFEKKSLVEKMKKARERKRRENGRCEGRKPAQPEAIAIAIDLYAKGLSLRQIGTSLAEAGFFVVDSVVDEDPKIKIKKRVMSNRPYGPQSIKAMLKERNNG